MIRSPEIERVVEVRIIMPITKTNGKMTRIRRIVSAKEGVVVKGIVIKRIIISGTIVRTGVVVIIVVTNEVHFIVGHVVVVIFFFITLVVIAAILILVDSRRGVLLSHYIFLVILTRIVRPSISLACFWFCKLCITA